MNKALIIILLMLSFQACSLDLKLEKEYTFDGKIQDAIYENGQISAVIVFRKAMDQCTTVKILNKDYSTKKELSGKLYREYRFYKSKNGKNYILREDIYNKELGWDVLEYYSVYDSSGNELFHGEPMPDLKNKTEIEIKRIIEDYWPLVIDEKIRSTIDKIEGAEFNGFVNLFKSKVQAVNKEYLLDQNARRLEFGKIGDVIYLGSTLLESKGKFEQDVLLLDGGMTISLIVPGQTNRIVDTGEFIFLSNWFSNGSKSNVVCVDKRTGSILWKSPEISIYSQTYFDYLTNKKMLIVANYRQTDKQEGRGDLLLDAFDAKGNQVSEICIMKNQEQTGFKIFLQQDEKLIMVTNLGVRVYSIQ